MERKIYLVTTLIDCREEGAENHDAYSEAFLDAEEAWNYIEEETDYLKDEYGVEVENDDIIDKEQPEAIETNGGSARRSFSNGNLTEITITYRILLRDDPEPTDGHIDLQPLYMRTLGSLACGASVDTANIVDAARKYLKECGAHEIDKTGLFNDLEHDKAIVTSDISWLFNDKWGRVECVGADDDGNLYVKGHHFANDEDNSMGGVDALHFDFETSGLDASQLIAVLAFLAHCQNDDFIEDYC